MTDDRRGDERRTRDRTAAEDAFLVAIDTRLAEFARTIKEAVREVRVARAIARLAVVAALLSVLIAVAMGLVLHEVRDEGRERQDALCGLAFLFDESIRLSGRSPEGELGVAYEQWKADINVIECPQYENREVR